MSAYRERDTQQPRGLFQPIVCNGKLVGKLRAFVIKLERRRLGFEQQLELEHPPARVTSQLYVLIAERGDQVNVVAVKVAESDRISAHLCGERFAEVPERAPLPDSSFFRWLCHCCVGEIITAGPRFCNAIQRHHNLW